METMRRGTSIAREIALSCKRKSHIWKKTNAHSMMKSLNSMLSTSCRVVASKVMKQKNSLLLLLHEHNTSIQFLNQSDSNPLFVPFELLVGSVSNLLLKMNSCVTTSCSCCILLVQLVTSLLCFFAIITLIQWSICTLRVQDESPRILVSASFSFGRNIRVVLFCDLVVCNLSVLIPSNVSL